MIVINYRQYFNYVLLFRTLVMMVAFCRPSSTFGVVTAIEKRKNAITPPLTHFEKVAFS